MKVYLSKQIEFVRHDLTVSEATTAGKGTIAAIRAANECVDLFNQKIKELPTEGAIETFKLFLLSATLKGLIA